MTPAAIDTKSFTENKTRGGSGIDKEKRFDWPLCYDAEKLVLDHIAAFLRHNTFSAGLSRRMHLETGTLFIDWVDYLVLPSDAEPSLRAAGFTDEPLGETPVGTQKVLWHPEAMLPRVIVDRALGSASHPPTLAIRVEDLSDFMAVHGITAQPEGEPWSRFRRVAVSVENNTCFEAVECRGYRGCLPAKPHPAFLEARKLWESHERTFTDDANGFRHTHALLDRIIALVGRDLACHIVFAGERDYWQGRNRAAKVQKQRQDRLGLGWANHDHHTFRCSRTHFVDVMYILDQLGFERRERFYTGAQAGWGAQISDQPVEGIVTFCDVDLEPDETEIDFSRQVLPPPKRLGTIGLWVGLHGESFLEAGMHHLECRFDHNLLRDQLATEGVGTMKPFSDFPFLKQAFTEGERWPVRRERAERLLRAGLIDAKQCADFVAAGAIGSHLENLQRQGGFKGFNQKSVSVIIEATDPRRQGHGV